jgi:anti-sigma regulatory factor (Ser/Thr protein kinase)
VLSVERAFTIRRNDYSVLRPLSQWLLQQGAELGLSGGIPNDIDLCLHESLSNVIRHGCVDDQEHHARVLLSPLRSSVEVLLEDDALPFDASTAPPQPAAVSLEHATDSGRGIVLLRALTIGMRYEFVGGRNRLTMVFASNSGR